MQEAMVHLWRLELRTPGRKEVWYLQGCRFHLQNLVRQGRSVDSLKRFQTPVLDYEEGADGSVERSNTNGSVWEEISVNDLMAALSLWLTPQEKETLLYLMDGLSAREVARRLNVSHTIVNRHRCRIANLAVKMEIVPRCNALKTGGQI
jgi:DNA-directed RNA polymerase specialized sigma24 family protein